MEVELDIASELGDGAVASSVEECECPVGHTGTSCEVSLTVIPKICLFSISELQIRGVIEGNSKIIFLIAQRKYML